ncbi:MAG: formylmethanofuran dehydrogenase subunit C [Pseudomonadales bacterium]|nr:formylmethanofuran dehydrogenase subunit C [Pseudomonadales bacterium]
MSVTLHQLRNPDQHIDLRGILPQTLAGLSADAIRQLPLYAGNRRHPLGELFEVAIDEADSDTLRIVPMDGRLDHVGAGQASGSIEVAGSVGDLAGAGMRGGVLRISGSAGDHAGAAMAGGRLQIDGDSGDFTAAPLPGERRGQHGGIIRVRGNTGCCAGERMRRGLLLIEGDAGERLGHRMIAGTLYCGGQAGELAGYGMRRGTLLLRAPARTWPGSLADNGQQVLPFLVLLLREVDGLLGNGSALSRGACRVQRYVGDLACAGCGEILILD